MARYYIPGNFILPEDCKVAAGHGHEMTTPGKRTPPIPQLGGRVIRENEFNRIVVEKLLCLLSKIGMQTIDVSATDDDSLRDRVKRANDFKADIFISVHYNAYDGIFDEEGNDPEGISIYIYPRSKYGRKLAESVMKYLKMGTAQKVRGIKEKGFYVVKYTRMPAMLSENGFMDNLREALLMLDETFTTEVAKEHAMGVCEYFGVEYIDYKFITDNPSASLMQAREWARIRGATKEFIDLAPIYWQECEELGIDPAGAYAQSAKETGYGRFGGVINASFKNPCGMKRAAGGSNSDPNAHQRFGKWEHGIKAHLDHLALYAGVHDYPKNDTYDPRHFEWIRGRARCWEDLGGNWAPSKTYGKDIVKMMDDMSAINEADIVVTPEYDGAWEKSKLFLDIYSEKLNDGLNPDKEISKKELMEYFDRLGLLG
jgi:N-acetylmuramoyl-L-alanine amidase